MDDTNGVATTTAATAAVHYLLPSRVVAVYQKHGWEPISGQFWHQQGAAPVSCCGAGAVALHLCPDLANDVISQSGDTERASPALFAVSEVLHAPLTYTWDFTLGFDRGFNESMKGEATGIGDDELEMRRVNGLYGVEDGLKSGRLVAAWWKSKQAHATKG